MKKTEENAILEYLKKCQDLQLKTLKSIENEFYNACIHYKVKPCNSFMVDENYKKLAYYVPKSKYSDLYEQSKYDDLIRKYHYILGKAEMIDGFRMMLSLDLGIDVHTKWKV